MEIAYSTAVSEDMTCSLTMLCTSTDTVTVFSTLSISILHLTNLHFQLGSITFGTKESYLAGEQASPGVPFTLLNTWSSCNAVTFRYVLSPPGLKVQGMAVAEVQQAKKNGTGVGEGNTKWQIKTFYGEFNSAVWLTDLKGKVVGCDVNGNVTGNGTDA